MLYKVIAWKLLFYNLIQRHTLGEQVVYYQHVCMIIEGIKS